MASVRWFFFFLRGWGFLFGFRSEICVNIKLKLCMSLGIGIELNQSCLFAWGFSFSVLPMSCFLFFITNDGLRLGVSLQQGSLHRSSTTSNSERKCTRRSWTKNHRQRSGSCLVWILIDSGCSKFVLLVTCRMVAALRSHCSCRSYNVGFLFFKSMEKTTKRHFFIE